MPDTRVMNRMLTYNTRVDSSPDECMELLRAYGVGTRDDALRVATLLRNSGNTAMAAKILLCWAMFARKRNR